MSDLADRLVSAIEPLKPVSDRLEGVGGWDMRAGDGLLAVLWGQEPSLDLGVPEFLPEKYRDEPDVAGAARTVQETVARHVWTEVGYLVLAHGARTVVEVACENANSGGHPLFWFAVNRWPIAERMFGPHPDGLRVVEPEPYRFQVEG